MPEKPTYEELEQRIIELEQAIQKRRKVEETSKNTSQLLSFFIKHSPIYAFLKKVSHQSSKVLYASDNFINMIGLPGSQMTGKTMHELFPHEFAEKITRDDIDVIHKGKKLKLDEELNGRSYVTYKFPLLQGGKKYLAGYTVDTTDLKQAEDDLAQIFAMSLDLICIADINTATFIKVNPAFTEILGYSEKELLEKSFFDFIHPEDADETRAVIDRKLKMNVKVVNFENRYRCKDGGYRWLSWVAHPNTEKGLTFSVARDITEWKENQRALKESEVLLRELFENMGTGIAIYESPDDGQSFIFKYVNRYGLALGQLRKEGVIGREVRDVFPMVVAIGLFDVFQKVWKTGQPQRNPSSIYQDGRVKFWVESYVFKLPSGQLVAIYEDTTAKKEAEAAKDAMEKQLRHAQKMESVGRLAGGVAHDFNNMLSVILGYAELAIDEIDPSAHIYEAMQEIKKAANRSVDITRQLLAFARKQPIAPKLLNLNKHVEKTLNMLQRLIGEDIELLWMPEKSLWPVKMDPSQIDQILANLCVNARDAISGVGRVIIKTGKANFDDAFCANHPSYESGEFVFLEVSDDGCGMTKEIRQNLFEPFFTTKSVDKGTGLGLATVYGIVKQNNGFINVYSEPNKGTTFKIYLPRTQILEYEVQAKAPVISDPMGRETILLVEDEPAILSMITKMLELLGYNVLPAVGPVQAIEIAREYGGQVHLLMTDVIMPDMNGRELAMNLLTILPNLKCLFISGYTADVIAHHGILDEGVHYMQKPFSKKDLSLKVREALDEAPF